MQRQSLLFILTQGIDVKLKQTRPGYFVLHGGNGEPFPIGAARVVFGVLAERLTLVPVK